MSLESILRKGKKFVVGGMITANVLGLYNCDNNPMRDVPSEMEDIELEVHSGETNEEGYVSFEDGESLYVLDPETNKGVENIKIGRIEHGDYEVISSYDGTGEYLPLLRFKENNLGNIYLSKEENEINHLSNNERNNCLRFLREVLQENNELNRHRCKNFKRLYYGEEALNGYWAINGLFVFLGAGNAFTVAGELASLSGLIGDNESLEEYILDNNWDYYEFVYPAWEEFNLENPPIYGFTVPSNKPKIVIDKLDFDDSGRLNLKITGFDKDYYEDTHFNGEHILDETIYCLATIRNDYKLGLNIRPYPEYVVGYGVLQGGLPYNEETSSFEYISQEPWGKTNYLAEFRLIDDTYDVDGVHFNYDSLITLITNH